MSDPSMIGPSLPPNLTGARSIKSNKEAQDIIGPQLPSIDEENESATKASYGPSLPPGMNYGPSIPEDTKESDKINDDDDDIIGPLPPTGDMSDDSLTTRKREIEARAQAMKNKLTKSDTDTQPQRESWMTELPSGEMKIGLGPRKFRSKYAELGDQSVWTDTPADKARKTAAVREKDALTGIKVDVKKQEAADMISQRDKELARQVEEYNKKYRSETLSEISRKRQKETGSDAPKEKKMFNPETDLQLPKIMSQRDRKDVLKKSAKDLQSKFTHGSQGHFL